MVQQVCTRIRKPLALVYFIMISDALALIIHPISPRAGASINCASISVNLATGNNYNPFKDVDKMLEVSFRALGHDVNVISTPKPKTDMQSVRTEAVPALPSGTGGLTVVTSLCSYHDDERWYGHRLPRETIVVQLEPLAIGGIECCHQSRRRALGGVVWDYTRQNLRAYHDDFCKLNNSLIELISYRAFPGLRSGPPPVYFPGMDSRLADTCDAPPRHNFIRDEWGGSIDVLVIGSLQTAQAGERRYDFLHNLSARGLAVHILTQSWDNVEREWWIARSRVLVNIHRQFDETPHEQFRGDFPTWQFEIGSLLRNNSQVESDSVPGSTQSKLIGVQCSTFK